MATLPKISPCLWFDDQAEEAARFYVSVFDDAEIDMITRYGEEGFEIHGRPEGSVMTVDFVIGDQRFTALNGGPHFTFSEAVSFQVFCEDQAEIDRFWSALSEGGEEGQCGWLKDRFGLSWQVVPTAMTAMMRDGDPAGVARVTEAFLQMKKFDLAALERAYAGGDAP